MAKKNDSTQVNECLKHMHEAKTSEAGSKPHRRLSHDCSMEMPGPAPAPDMSPIKQQKEEPFPSPGHTVLKDSKSTDAAGSSPQQRHSHNSSTEASGQASGPASGPASAPDSSPNIELKMKPGCRMQFEELFPSPRHTVLIDTEQFLKGKLVPHKMQHVWDSYHVKLPLVKLKTTMDSHWNDIQKALRKLAIGDASVKDVEMAIKSYNPKYSRDWPFDALNTYVRDLHAKENNFSFVIAKMAQLALALPEYITKPIPLLRQNNCHSITLSQVQISCLLANAFFCTFPHRNSTKPNSEYANFPTINFSSLFGNACRQKTQKLRAIFHYFNTVTDKDTRPDGLVTFERICIPPSDLPHWKRKTETLTRLRISAEGSIEEEGKGMLQMDFASKFIGGGVLGRGLVQEEICFLMNPELIVARLFTEKLADNECLKISGTQRYSVSSGYSDTFEWQGPYSDNTMRDKWKRRYCQIVAIDALSFRDTREQYTKENLKRELNKAYVGFRSDPSTPPKFVPTIATGNWGCGAFNGDPKLKALIQMMAAAVVRRDLAYFTFGNKEQANEIQKMHEFLSKNGITVGNLYRLLVEYCEHFNPIRKPKNLYEFIKENSGHHSSQL